MSAPETAREDAQQSLLETYKTLLVRAAHMHQLAETEQWAELIEQQTHYVALVEALRDLEKKVSLDDSAKYQKAELLEQILEHDVEIRRRLVSRREELSKLIGSSLRQRDLHRAYAPQQGPAVGDVPDQGAT